jgi:hypothetical protein
MEQPTEFELMLRKFNRTVDNQPPVSEVKETLTKLRELSINSKALNSRQTDAIVARCDHYINGTYGKNAKKEVYQQPA